MIPLWPRILPIWNAKHRQNPVTVRGHGVPVYCNRLAVQGWLWGLKHCMGGKSLVRWNEGEKSKETKEKKGGTEKAFSCGRSIL